MYDIIIKKYLRLEIIKQIKNMGTNSALRARLKHAKKKTRIGKMIRQKTKQLRKKR